MQKVLTIVIPTYNMQDYLHRCLDSLIVNDKELLKQIEILVINDGSRDNSSQIAHEYESMYPETFRVIDKENGNYGSCVNRGLNEASGKYIKVLDADDWFDTNEFESFIVHLNVIDADMILTPFSIVNATSNEVSLAYKPNMRSGEKYDVKQLTIDEAGVYMMHAVTYRIELLRSISYHQTEGISYTDTEWIYNPLYAVETLVYLNYNVYQYLIGREGQTMDPKVMLRTINHHETIARSLIDNERQHRSVGFAHATIERQILYLLKLIYKTRLVLQDNNNYEDTAMQKFDSYIRMNRLDMYKKTGKLIIKPCFPVPYVFWWRIFKHRFPIDKIRNIYRNIRYGKRD